MWLVRTVARVGLGYLSLFWSSCCAFELYLNPDKISGTLAAMKQNLEHASLKQRQRAEREGWPDGLGLRVHRALSWLDRAEQCSDLDGRFIFLWIAFNAAYAQDLSAMEVSREQQRLNRFLEKLVSLDSERCL